MYYTQCGLSNVTFFISTRMVTLCIKSLLMFTSWMLCEREVIKRSGEEKKLASNDVRNVVDNVNKKLTFDTLFIRINEIGGETDFYCRKRHTAV